MELMAVNHPTSGNAKPGRFNLPRFSLRQSARTARGFLAPVATCRLVRGYSPGGIESVDR